MLQRFREERILYRHTQRGRERMRFNLGAKVRLEPG